MTADQQIDKLIIALDALHDKMDEKDPDAIAVDRAGKVLAELLEMRRINHHRLLQLSDARDFFKRQTELSTLFTS